MKILIVKASALGDVIHALPVLPYLKSVDPEVEIDWLVEEGFAPLLEGHPLLNCVYRLQTKSWRKAGMATAISKAFRVIAELRKQHYDLVLDLQGNSKSGLFTLFSGSRKRFGFDRNGVREWPNLLATNHKVSLKGEPHITDRSLAIAQAACPAGTEIATSGPLPVDAAAREMVAAQLQQLHPGSPLLVFHYGTTWSTKLWSKGCWRTLTERLVEDGLRPVFTWGSDWEREAVEEITAGLEEQVVIWPRGSLKEFVALIDAADLVIGGDTGPVHIAAAVGTPTISLFRVTDSHRNGPRGENHIRLQSPLDCSPCLRKECPRDRECGESISFGLVYQTLQRLLEKLVC